MKNYSFTKTAIVRTPLEEKKMDLTWEQIQEIFAKKENREALFLGSPNIYKAMTLWEKGELFQKEEELKNLKGSLYKYASRLANRATPFGMFATVASAQMTNESNMNIGKSELVRFTKFDMYFLAIFLPEITKNESIRSVLKFYTNNSAYEVFDKYRYVEYYYKNHVRFHKISEVEKTDYLSLIYTEAKKGIQYNDLVQLLISDDISKDDASEFISKLIENQFIVSELEFTVTGQDYFEKLLNVLEEDRFDFYEAHVIKNLVNTLKDKINDLDKNCINDSQCYYEIHDFLTAQLGNEIDITKLFQVDTSRKIDNGSIGFKTLKAVRAAVTALNKLSSYHENDTLKEFKKNFQERYEEYEQPLIKVLDPDLGIGYGSKSGAKTPLVDNLLLMRNYSEERKFSMDFKKTFLFKKLLEAHKNNWQSVEITDDEIKSFGEDERLYPFTFSVFTNIFTENGKEKVNLKSVSGPTANGLIGRFTHLDPQIFALSNEITEIEKNLSPDKIVAEIVHLPQARTGNILYRSFQREYEIPYLANASVDQEHQILIEDLLVSVKNNKVILRSKKLNKEIIPRLSNAHNYSSNALPIYHFLCDIQNQESSGFAFSWGALQSEFDFLPRVSYKDIIFSRATWNINKKDIDDLLANDESNAVKVIRAFRKSRNIPNLIYITQGDNEVLINFENDLSCIVFYNMLKGERFLQLKEFLFKEDCITETYCNEVVLIAYKNLPENQEQNIQKDLHQLKNINYDVKKSFSMGEKWLYYKFYCGERAGEEILNKVISPLVAELEQKKIAEKWFFIRYYDAQGPHLRFRVLLKDLNLFTDCINTVKKFILPFEVNNVIWKTQTDTYLRELQRYGFDSIEATETLFYNDSLSTLEFVDMIEGDEGEKVRWLYSLLSMDHFLNDFGFSFEKRMQLFNVAKTNFGKEFNRSGKLNKQINEYHATHEIEIENFLSRENTHEDYFPIWEVLMRRSKANEEAVSFILNKNQENALKVPLEDLILSYLHMICNRIFISKQRVHEMVVYDFMYKYYNKKLHLTKENKTELETINL